MSDTQSDGDSVVSSRRQFLTVSAAGATVAWAATSSSCRPLSAAPSSEPSPSIHVQPRYHRWHVDPGMPWVETNTGYAHLDWTFPLNQAALILVDVWDHHYLKDTEARAEQIINEKLAPLLVKCRQAGLRIIHAPSPTHAMRHPNWVNAGKSSTRVTEPASWPPAEFRSKIGEFQSFRRPAEPREPELARLRAGLKIHPQVQPHGDEAVVATGEELHHLCEQTGVLFLFFAGFNTNACILVRDYGTLDMSRRGYEVLLIRDCTTGMESRDSQPALSQTHGAILLLEMFGQYTVTAEELVTGFRGV